MPAHPLVEVTRDGVVESSHLGHVAVCDVRGQLLAGVGEPHEVVYPRSALKPMQLLGVLGLLGDAVTLDDRALAIAAASHTGTADQQIEAARVLALADLDESALACPPALPADEGAVLEQGTADRLTFNCSGKHAAFLLATVAVGGDPSRYLAVDSDVQREAQRAIERLCGAPAQGPGMDGCGAPAWRLPLSALATGFARLAAGIDGDGRDEPDVERIRRAMRRHPELVGGTGCADTALMAAQDGVVAKRGAEGVLAAGFARAGRAAVGIAVKVADGGDRASGPVVATLLHSLGAAVPAHVARPPVLGGGRPHGSVRPSAGLERVAATLTT